MIKYTINNLADFIRVTTKIVNTIIFCNQNNPIRHNCDVYFTINQKFDYIIKANEKIDNNKKLNQALNLKFTDLQNLINEEEAFEFSNLIVIYQEQHLKTKFNCIKEINKLTLPKKETEEDNEYFVSIKEIEDNNPLINKKKNVPKNNTTQKKPTSKK